MKAAAGDIAELLEIMARLRQPVDGCPWDLAQTFATIAPYTIEEAYEVADAIDRGDMADLRDELGDLLLQVVFHARMAEEQGAFDFAGVVDAIVDKMVRRHPHVFAGAGREADAEAQLREWETLKRGEREAAGNGDASALAGIARGLPEWQRAIKLQKRAATVGFDWPGPEPVVAKLHEEIDEALRIIRDEHGHDVVVLLGHSAGGLIAALWADRHPRSAGRATTARVDALVLNSPWLDLQGSWFERTIAIRLIDALAPWMPLRIVGKLGPDYGRSLHVSTGGAWDYDLRWKPFAGFPVRAGWLRAIHRGHRAVAGGLAIDVPVLVCCSTASGPDDRWHEAITRTDSVLDVEQIAARTPGLGADVTLARIPDGIHDLALSPEPARSRYVDAVFAWAATHVGRPGRG